MDNMSDSLGTEQIAYKLTSNLGVLDFSRKATTLLELRKASADSTLDTISCVAPLRCKPISCHDMSTLENRRFSFKLVCYLVTHLYKTENHCLVSHQVHDSIDLSRQRPATSVLHGCSP